MGRATRLTEARGVARFLELLLLQREAVLDALDLYKLGEGCAQQYVN